MLTEKNEVQKICRKFRQILTNKRTLKEDENVDMQKINQLWSKNETKISELKGKNAFALGQKIPSSVKPFTRQEIESR